MGDVQQYPATKHPDSNLDYVRRWFDVTHIENVILTTKVTSPDGTITETETINEEIIVDEKGWLRDDEVIIESDWEISADNEKIPTLVISEQGTGIGEQGTVTSVFLKGGTAGIRYKLTNHIKAFNTKNEVFRYESKLGVITCCY